MTVRIKDLPSVSTTTTGDRIALDGDTTRSITVENLISAGSGDVVGPASATDGGFAKFDGTTGKLIKDHAATVSLTTEVSGTLPAANGGTGFTAALKDTIEFVIDGGGSTITTGIKGDIEIPYACTITQATLLADQSGSIVVNVWVDTYANFPPTVADKITASAPPTISTATKSQDSTLTGWTTTLTSGSTMRFNVDSVTTIQRATLSLKVTRTAAS